MRFLGELKYIFRQLNRSLAERELEDEIRAHLENEIQQMVDRGMSPVEARRAAIRAFGSVALSKERSRKMWGFHSFEIFFQDIKYGARMLIANRVFTAVAVLSLALGIGANTAIFSLVNAVLLKTLPVKQPDQLVLFRWQSGPNMLAGSINGGLDMRGGKKSSSSFSYPTFRYISDTNSVLSDAIAFAQLEQLSVGINGQAEIASGQIVSGRYYDALGVDPILGRLITAQDDAAGATPVAVISYAYWERRFGRDQAIVGKIINLNRVPFTIIGVTPARFLGTLDVDASSDISVPMAVQNQVMSSGPILQETSNWWVHIIGRLKPGVSTEQAQGNLDTVFLQIITADQASIKDKDIPQLVLLPGSHGISSARESYIEPLSMLMGVVGLVLLIACANVANLLLARASSRQKEIAVRLALGASRGRLIRMLLTESMMLAIIGGSIGLFFATLSQGLLVDLMSQGRAKLAIDTTLDFRMLLFTGAVTLLTGLLFGIAPAFRATRVDLTPSLKDSDVRAGRSRFALGKLLVVVQVGLSTLLLIGSGLFIRTLLNLKNVDTGFNSENVLLFRIDPTLNGYRAERLANLYDQIVERIQSTPGVRSVTMSRHMLLSGSGMIDKMSVPGFTSEGKLPYTYVQRVRDNFFDTMEIAVIAGRGFNVHDVENSQKVAIINEAAARYYFGNENPIGKRFDFGDKPGAGTIEIVGLTKNTQYADMRGGITPMTAYIPYTQNITRLGQMAFEVRTAGDPHAIAPAVREAVRSIDKDLPLFEMKTQQEQIAQSMAQETFFARLSSLFGLLALILACVGLYGVMSYGVARRTKEMGIRMALGARRQKIIWLVLKESLLLIAIGIAIGLPAAYALTRLAASMLFGLEATDPATFAGVAIILTTVALLSCYLPARRATKIDPMIALRYE